MNHLPLRGATAVLALLSVAAAVVAAPTAAAPTAPAVAAAAAPATGRADPLDPQAAVPALRHRPVLDGYRPTTAAVPAPAGGTWRDANDTVGRIGGWRTYTREAHRAVPAPDHATAAERAASASGARRDGAAR